MFKKFYFFAVALLCATTVLAGNSEKDEYEYYEDEFEIDGIEYYAEDTISAYVFEHKNNKATTVVIPAYVTHNGFTYRVESIANKAFRDSKNLESITIGAAEIGEKAFCDCYNLQSITLLEGVEYINNAAFSGTAITTLHLPATFKNFGKNGYNSVPTTDCEAFSTYTVSPENPNFCAVDGILYTKDMKQLYSCPTLNQNFKGFAPTIEIVKQNAFNNCTLMSTRSSFPME